MTTVTIFDLSSESEDSAETIELSNTLTKNIAGGFWFCRFTPRLFVYPLPKSKANLVA